MSDRNRALWQGIRRGLLLIVQAIDAELYRRDGWRPRPGDLPRDG